MKIVHMFHILDSLQVYVLTAKKMIMHFQNYFFLKKMVSVYSFQQVSKHVHEMPQSHTEDQPTPNGISLSHQLDKFMSLFRWYFIIIS